MTDPVYLVVFRTPTYTRVLTYYDYGEPQIFRTRYDAERAIQGHMLQEWANILEVPAP